MPRRRAVMASEWPTATSTVRLATERSSTPLARLPRVSGSAATGGRIPSAPVRSLTSCTLSTHAVSGGTPSTETESSRTTLWWWTTSGRKLSATRCSARRAHGSQTSRTRAGPRWTISPANISTVSPAPSRAPASTPRWTSTPEPAAGLRSFTSRTRMARPVTSSPATLRRQQCGDGAHQQPQVEPQRPVLDVRQVELHHLGVGESVAAGDLPITGHARAHAVPAAVHRAKGVSVHRQRARPDVAHVAAEHVPQLRELVDGEPAEDPPYARDPRVVAHLEQKPVRRVP